MDWTAVKLDEGEPIPELSDFDALWVMGGPMDTWQEDAHPWLVPEWACVPEYAQALEASLGQNALARFEAEAAQNMAAFNRDARRLYKNFMAAARGL